MDNATLFEMVDFCFELLEKFPLELGSVVLYGSASLLFVEWGSAFMQGSGLMKIGAKWRNLHIFPWIPFDCKNCPGSLAQDIEQLAAWILKVYSNNIDGLSDCWCAERPLGLTLRKATSSVKVNISSCHYLIACWHPDAGSSNGII
jgi:hypothetical protein